MSEKGRERNGQKDTRRQTDGKTHKKQKRDLHDTMWQLKIDILTMAKGSPASETYGKEKKDNSYKQSLQDPTWMSQ